MARSQQYYEGASENTSTTSKHSYKTSSTASIEEDIMPGETSPLLAHDGHRPATAHFPRRRTLRSPHSIMAVVLLAVFLTCCGDQFVDSPETRIFESVICYRYYEKVDPSKIKLGRDVVGPGAIGGVDEMWCKADAVQDQLAVVNGYQSFFDGWPALILALPFGWAADRFGRWPFLFINLVQFALKNMWRQFVTWDWQAFDIRAIWGASGFAILGGGSATASAMFFVLVSDVLPAEERAGAFLRLGASNLAPSLFIPPLAAWLMTINPWIPYLIGTLMLVLAAVLCLFIPETLGYGRRDHGETAELPPSEETVPESSRPESAAVRYWNGFRSSISFLTEDWRIPALIIPFVVHILISNLTRLILQYSSKRYGLTIAQGTLLITLHNGIHVLLLFALLPYLSTFVMKRFNLCNQKKDLYLTRVSHVFMAIGWLCVAASPNVWTVAISLSVASLGVGSALLMRSFLTSLLPAHHIARTYSAIGIVDTLGAMFGTPALAGLFKDGLSLGGGWVGLPFYVIGLASALFAGLLFLVKLRKSGGSEQNDRDEE
ncbi:hypothetical protein M409DRAFT_49763 [Zasmidium cellare ATCC 36951]|uniref:Major facilitator superfamily (MFS) profile domain-containing protein n=1 Tax=Zasmidium cellare ATCC 36951 TaxID=1080233 RepID=A0A6A6D1R9_ZASCE|nr:uncharacterized protein M409DRAFT_49763 [Zasmidium cellare ATCC 36951]KAF2173301.1 hypothetical protein M409DRAFT_49763 [Zasmidium cellare ATCC 36951]